MIEPEAIDNLERRVSTLERQLREVREGRLRAEVERAKSLLFAHLQTSAEVDPVRFAAHNDLSLEAVEQALAEFDRRGWTVPSDD